MSTGLIGLIAFIAIALVGWGIAEMKSKNIEFTHSQEEADEIAHLKHLHPDQTEQNIRDILKNNSTNGYNAVG